MASPWYPRFLIPNTFFAAVSGTLHTVTEQLWAGWWRQYFLSSADQSPAMRTVYFQCQQLLVFCCLVLLTVT